MHTINVRWWKEDGDYLLITKFGHEVARITRAVIGGGWHVYIGAPGYLGLRSTLKDAKTFALEELNK